MILKKCEREKSRDVSCEDGNAIQCPVEGLAINRSEAHLVPHEESGVKDG